MVIPIAKQHHLNPLLGNGLCLPDITTNANKELYCFTSVLRKLLKPPTTRLTVPSPVYGPPAAAGWLV